MHNTKKVVIYILMLIFVFSIACDQKKETHIPKTLERVNASPDKVEWRVWSAEAFEAAKSEDKPVLLYLCPTWSHWCHKMDESTYQDDEVVKIIEENFVPIKVDPDERPDINARYNVGGVPTTVFLTPTGNILTGQKYVPPAEMRNLLDKVVREYRENKKELTAKLEEFKKVSMKKLRDMEKGELRENIVDTVFTVLEVEFDEEYGGWGDTQKFIPIEALNFLILHNHIYEKKRPRSMFLKTLDEMAMGGIHDHLGGGFHRYAIDTKWIVPHFEKMTMLNSQLLMLYLQAYQMTKEETYKEVAMGILDYLESNMQANGGGFYNAQDADIGYADNGAYYTWTLPEIKHYLTKDEAEVFTEYYDVQEDGELAGEIGQNVLFARMTVEELAAEMNSDKGEISQLLTSAEDKIRKAQAMRPKPEIDKTIYTDTSAKSVVAYLYASSILNRPELKEFALKTLDMIIDKRFDTEHGVYHDENSGTGYLNDNIYTIEALMTAYEHTTDRNYLALAEKLAGYVSPNLADPANDGFYDFKIHKDAIGHLAMKQKPLLQNAEAASIFYRLYRLSGEEKYKKIAEESLRLFVDNVMDERTAAARYGQTLMEYYHYPLNVVIIGKKGTNAMNAMVDVSLNYFSPYKDVRVFDPKIKNDMAQIKKLSYPPSEEPTAYVCIGEMCYRPLTEPKNFVKEIPEFIKMISEMEE